KPAFTNGIRADYEKIRTHHAEQKAKPLLSIDEARRRRTPIDWTKPDIAEPEFVGSRILATDLPPQVDKSSSLSLSDLVPFIDWSPFFHTWELRGRYPAILENPEAKKLFDDAQELLGKIVSGRLLEARAVYGFFPATSVG